MAIKFLSGLNLSNITAGSILKLDSSGNIVAATAGTDYATSASAVWSTSGSNPTTAYYTGNVRVGTYQASVEASARLHVFDYQTTTPKLLIEDGNTGDASMQFKISTKSYVMGIDNSDSDVFKFSASSAFDTTNVFTVNTSGNVTFASDVYNAGIIRTRNNNYGVLSVFGSEGFAYEAQESSNAVVRYWLRFDSTNGASFPYLTNRTPNGAVVIKTGTAAGAAENEHFRIKGGDGTVDAYFTNVNLGIGQTSPGAPLDVYTSADFVGRFASSDNKAFLVLKDDDTTTYWSAENAKMSLGFNAGVNASNLNIDGSGNVGIGTASPSYKLQVNGSIWSRPTSDGTSGTAIHMGRFTDADTPAYSFITDDYNGDTLYLYSNRWGIDYKIQRASSSGTKEVFRVNGEDTYGHFARLYNASNTVAIQFSSNGDSYLNGGNVGIGTTSPSQKLHVSGSAIITTTSSIDPDSYGDYVVIGNIADGSGWGAKGIGGNAGTGDSWAIAHNGSNLYFGIGNGTAANSMATYMEVSPSRVITLPSLATAGFVKTNASGSLSIDTNTYLTTSSASSTYLPLTGGTVANGNTAIPLTISRTSATTMQVGVRFYAEDGVNDPTDMYFGAGTDSEPYWATSANLSAGNMIWHEGNDGSGSGLDADTVDGIQASSFLRSDADDTFTGNLTTANSGWIRYTANNNTDSNDGKIGAGVFGSGLNIVGSQTTAGTGRQVRIWGSLITDAGATYWHSDNDGSGSGLNADLLDGNDASAFALASHSHSGADITSGTISTSRLDTDVVTTNTSQTISGNKYFTSDKFLKTNRRVANNQYYPLGHYTPGETVFEIDPTWTQNELRAFFEDSNVSWVADSTAPGGYCIYIDGAVNVGGAYSSGFPYIPVDTDDIFYMECWIKNEGTAQGHYMGSIDYNESFSYPSSGSGNPGSYGYWVMSNYTSASSWSKVSGYITGFSNTETGKFETGTKYWTPQALFNYSAGSGTRACRISGWKVIKVNHVGNRTFAGDVVVSGGLKIGTNNVATESYVSTALSNYSTTNHTHDASDVVSGQFDTARIPDLSGTYSVSSHTHSEYAPLASPGLTGTPTAPTASAGTNTTQIATTAFVSTAVSNLVDSAPGTLNTLNELAAALGDDANFSTTITNSIATKLSLTGGTVTGATTFDSLVTFKGHIKLYDGTYTGDWGGIESKQRSANSHDMIVYVADDGGSGDRIKLVSRHYSAGDTDLAIFDATFAEINTRLKLNTVDANTTSTTALVLNGAEIEKRTLGTAAFEATTQFAAASHAHDASDISSGQLDAARIPDLSSTYAVADHTHSYLPLSGGTLTGNLTLSNKRIDSAYDMFTGNGTGELEASQSVYGNINFKGVTAQSSGSTGTTQQGITWQINNYNNSTDYGTQAQIVVGNNGSVGTFMGFFTSDNWGVSPGEKLRIQADGKVGIGTVSPSRKLHVAAGTASPAARFENTSSNDTVLELYSSGDSRYMYFQTDHIYVNTGNMHFGNETGDIYLRTSSGGKVGIGTTSPASKLHVKDTSGSNALVTVRVENNLNYGELGTQSGYVRLLSAGYLLYAGSNSSTYFYNGGSVVMSTQSSGRVGIGTETPETKLHIHESGAADAIFRISAGDGAYDSVIQLEGQTDIGNEGFEIWYDNNVGDVHLVTTYEDDAAAIRFHTRTGASKSTANERMTIAGNGNVGIGNTSPTAKLQVGAEAHGSATGIEVAAGSGGANLLALDNSYNHNWFPYTDGINYYSAAAHTFRNADHTTIWMFISSAGNVGIGTSSPSSNLHVYNNADVWHTRIGGASGELRIGGQTSSGAVIQAYTPAGATRDLYLQRDGGNVGIGTTSPAAILDVQTSASTTSPTIRLGSTNASSQVYGMIATYDAYHGIIMRGIPTAASTYEVTPGDYMSFFEYGGDFRFYKKTASTLTEIARIEAANISLKGYSVINSPNNGDDIYGNIRVIRNLHKTDGMYIGYDNGGTTGAHLRFYANGTNERMRIDASNGNVGIGTTSPAYRLDVNGSVRMNSGAVFGDRITVSGNVENDSDKQYDLGTDASRWRVVYCETLDSAGQHEANLSNDDIQHLPTGTVLVWENGKAVPCCKFADHMKIGVAVHYHNSPLIQGAEPVLCTGEVEEGDYLVTSDKKGHAVALKRSEVMDRNLLDCVIGKALEYGSGDSHSIKTWINI